MSFEGRAGAVIYSKDIDRVAAFYSATLDFKEADRDGEHVMLESPAFQLVVLRMPEQRASKIQITVPPVRRADTAIKLVFFVPSLVDVRAACEKRGGVMNGPEKEWRFNEWKVCDGLDPEGNVIQFRERAG